MAALQPPASAGARVGPDAFSEALRASRLEITARTSVDDPRGWERIEQLVRRATVPGVRWIARAEGRPDALGYLLAVSGCPEVTPLPCRPGGQPRDRAAATFALHGAGEALTILEDDVCQAARLLLLVGDEHLRTGLGLLRGEETGAALGLARLAVLRPGATEHLILAEGPGPSAAAESGGRSAEAADLWADAAARRRQALGGSRLFGLGAAAAALAASALAVGIIHLRSAAPPPPEPISNGIDAPPTLDTSVAALDPHNGQVLLVGCCQAGQGGARLVVTWTWDGSAWRRLRPPSSPPWRSSPGFAVDPRSGDLLLQGGLDHSDTWSWNGTGWTQLHPAAAPPPGSLEMVSDPATGTVVALDPGERRAETGTWVWEGRDWRHVDAAPPTEGPFAYDPGTRRVLAVVDAPAKAADEQTWTFDGSTWTQVATTRVVPVEYFAVQGSLPDQMAADFVTGTVVYVEQPGVSANYVIPGDTYVWNGAWSRPSTITPLERQGLMVAGRPPLLIAPSIRGGSPIVWRWTGTDWRQVERGG